jgi:glycosyltransferase involved in cell wall biosynthesis
MMKIGIIATEFFDEQLGRMGGFGWAARQVARYFNSHPELGVTAIFLAAGLTSRDGRLQTHSHETLLIFDPAAPQCQRTIRRHRLDVLLTIDYRPKYRDVLRLFDRAPAIVWVRDPRPPKVMASLSTLRIPGDESASPRGIREIDCTSLADLMAVRTMRLASPAPSLNSLIEDTYHLPNVECRFLPNIVDIPLRPVRKHPEPRVIFLGRLDPIKRPWMFAELARDFPKIEFLMLGKSHFHGPGSWMPARLPNNVQLLGHVDGKRKYELLSSAWVLINTSIHEALATSFLEALACETPLLSCNNQEETVSRFGIFTGRFEGDGMAGLPSFAAGLRQLIESDDLRTELGRRGRRWVESTHNSAKFLEAFDAICAGLGRQRDAPASRPDEG